MSCIYLSRRIKDKNKIECIEESSEHIEDTFVRILKKFYKFKINKNMPNY